MSTNYQWQNHLLPKAPRAHQHLVWVLASLCFSFLVWAHFSSLEEVTRGNGKVVPSSRIQIIQSLDGGIIEELLVHEGLFVEKNAPLMRIDATRFASDLAQRAQEVLNLQFSVARLKAQLDSINIASENEDTRWQQQLFIDNQPIVLPDTLLQTWPELAQQHQNDYHNSIEQLKTQLAIQSQVIQQKENELKELATKANTLEISLQLVKRELSITEPLEIRGIVSEVELLKLQRQANDINGELEALQQLRPSLQLERNEAILRRREIALAYLTETQAAYNEQNGQLARLNQANIGAQDKVDRTLLRAPVTGIIKAINIATIGGVVQPGADLIEIVPSEDRLLIEAQIAPKDIAFLRPGLRASVKITAYDFTQYGGLQGTVEQIGADTVTDKNGNSYYIIRIRTDNNRLGRADEALPIIPGMTTTVDVLTGEKSVLAYLLKPILRAKNTALRER
ncbi:MAG: HlyD family type I secretion periplasmic adaptor subunit [Ferrimonas sp.]